MQPYLNIFEHMLHLLLWWLGLFALFSGIGLACRGLFGLPLRSRDSWFSSFWLGWAILVFWLQLIHLVHRIDGWVLLVLAVLALTGLILYARDLWMLLRRMKWRDLWTVIPALLLVLWMANRALAPVTNSDTGLYHMGAVLWNSTYPIVKGLGNLHGRFAFNNAHFLYVALLDVGPWADRAYHLANGFLITALLVQTVLGLRSALAERRQVYISAFLLALMLGPTMQAASSPNVTSFSADYALVVLGIVLLQQLALFVSLDNPGDAEERFHIFCIFALASLGVTIKLSFAAFAAAACLATIWIWYRRSTSSPNSFTTRKILKTFLPAALISAFAVLTWMGRGLLLSGYIAYPSAVGSLPLPWRVPRSLTLSEALWIRSWARLPWTPWVDALQGWGWLSTWVGEIPTDLIKATGLTIASLLLWLLLMLFPGQSNRRRASSVWLLLLPPLATIVFWFLTAPSFRFAGAGVWLLSAAAVLLLVDSHTFTTVRRGSFIKALVIAAVFIFAWRQPNPLFVPMPEDGQLPPRPMLDVLSKQTDSGLQVQVTAPGNFKCWDAELPCTPYYRPNLRVFAPGDISQGFFLDDSFTYADFQQATLPTGISAPADIGVALVSYLIPAEYDVAVRDDSSRLRLLIYTEEAGTVTLSFAVSDPIAPTGEQSSSKIDLIVNNAHAGTFSIDAPIIETDIELQKDFNIIQIQPATGQIVLGESQPLNGDAAVSTITLSGITIRR